MDVKAASLLTRPSVEVTGLGFRAGDTWLLRDVEFAVEPGSILGVIGPSGAGKSTLLRCLNGLIRPTQGSVRVGGTEVATLLESRLPSLRRRVGMVFQNFNLFSAETVLGNVALPLRVTGMQRRVREARARQLLDLVGLADQANKYAAQLSGGQKQRVGIARALAAEPELLLCDEATSALDTDTTASILDLLREVNRRLALTIVLVTHDLAVVRAIASRVLVLDGGRVVESGATARVIADPAAPATRRIVATGRVALPASLATRLRPHAMQGDVAVFRLEPRDHELRRPLLDEVARLASIAPVLLAGGIDHVGEDAYGTLFIGLPLPPAEVSALAVRLPARASLVGWIDGAV